MTDHAKILGIGFLIFGLINTLVLILIAVFMVLGLGGMLFFAREAEALFGAALGIFGLIVMLLMFFVLMALPHLLAGYTFLKRKKSSKIFGIIASVFSFMTFPLGTALAIYCFWFIFGEAGNKFYNSKKMYWSNFE